MRTHTKESQQNMTPTKALQYLKDGNERFVQNLKAHRDHLDQVNETRERQYPFAAILSCIDSRVSAELVFDQGLGDIFSIRIAGNVLNDDILGSMEFACKIAGSKLIVVLGHSKCGAVKGAVNGVKMGSLTGLLKKIEPAIETVKHTHSADQPGFMDEVVEQNVRDVAVEILEKSSILSEMVKAGEIDIARGVYSVDTGKVEFC